MDVGAFREGILSLRTTRFGAVAELMIQRLLALGKGRSRFHDLYDDVANKRVEVKFCQVRRKALTPITPSTLFQCIEEASGAGQMVPFLDWQSARFDCNIQQVKRAEFDVLYYGLFFAESIVIFRIGRDEIGREINYCDRQHKGNVGEGQFHITPKSLPVHLGRHHYRTLSYEELLRLLSD